MALLRLDVNLVDRRPNSSFREVRADALSPIAGWAGPCINRRPVQNPPQFSGTITPAGERVVYLKEYGKDQWLDRTASDSEGNFVFRGVYSELVQYEFYIIDNDGTVSQAYHVDNPTYSPYPGNPSVNDTSGASRV
jgi:hypothetical protein